MPSRRQFKRALAVVSAAAALLVAPTAAFAVNVSSNDGSGTQVVDKWYRAGAYMKGKLTSTLGYPVYYNGNTVVDGGLDGYFGRYTSDTTSLTAVNRNGQLGSSGTPSGFINGVKVRVCRNRDSVPDPCGAWSATIRK